MAADPIDVKRSSEAKASQDKPLIFSAIPSPKSVKKDYQLNTEELRKLAESNDPSAQLISGLRFSLGTDGCSKSPEGQKWITTALNSKKNPAVLCAQGFCFEQASEGAAIGNSKMAKELYNKAIEQGYIPAMFLLGVMLSVEGMTTTPEDQDKLKKAAGLFTTCVDAGYTPAYNYLAICYVNGHGVQENKNEGFRLLRLGANSGDCGAKRNLGLCYENGWGVEASKSEAKRWFREAETQGYDVKADLDRVSSTCLIM